MYVDLNVCIFKCMMDVVHQMLLSAIYNMLGLFLKEVVVFYVFRPKNTHILTRNMM